MPSPTQQPLAPIGHVGLMIDTYIANTNLEDLRAVVRALLVTGPPNTTSAFQKVVKQRLRRERTNDRSSLPPPHTLFTSYVGASPYSSPSSASSSASLPSTSSSPEPTDPHFTPVVADLLRRARALFGAGLGLQSLPILTLLIHGTHSLHWTEDGDFVDTLAILDSDISQAVQSSLEEVAASDFDNLVGGAEEGIRAVTELQKALKACEQEVESWGGEFPFQRGLANMESFLENEVWHKAIEFRAH